MNMYVLILIGQRDFVPKQIIWMYIAGCVPNNCLHSKAGLNFNQPLNYNYHYHFAASFFSCLNYTVHVKASTAGAAITTRPGAAGPSGLISQTHHDQGTTILYTLHNQQ